MITTIIFDLDGTLMNTLDDLHTSVTHALSKAGLPVCDKKDTRRFLGNGVKALIDKCVAQACPDATTEMKDAILADFRTHYAQHSMDKTAPYEGVMEMLTECRKQGLHTAIVSNKPDSAVKDLHRQFFANTIDCALGETPEVKRKPAPDMVQKAIRQLSDIAHRQIELTECVYVGDSEVDLATATNTNLPCVSVSWGFRDRDLLTSCGATTIIDHPAELLQAIEIVQNKQKDELND